MSETQPAAVDAEAIARLWGARIKVARSSRPMPYIFFLRDDTEVEAREAICRRVRASALAVILESAGRRFVLAVMAPEAASAISDLPAVRRAGPVAVDVEAMQRIFGPVRVPVPRTPGGSRLDEE